MQLEPWQWLLGALGAFLVGIAKTGIPGLGILSVAIFGLAFPTRDSVGLVLIMLICADIVAVSAYRHDASWPHLWRLFPWAVAGIIVGYLALGRVNEVQMRRLLGAILLGLSLLQLLRARRPAAPANEPHWLFAPLTGVTGGFTTMVANAAGPVMVIYLLAMRLPKLSFVGTSAWFFFLLNLFKVPFSASLGLINPSTLGISLALGLVAMAGAGFGRPLVERLNQRVFELTALGLTFVAALLMVR
ncbi:MAG: sulfite exporter TauE/SafE family protein [Chloroflexi bacterium OHK40]